MNRSGTVLLNKMLRGLGIVLSMMISTAATAAEEKRRIEEIVVTAEKVESTVSDTSISITAFSAETIENFGIQGADELINFIPATTRDSFDIRIRGVGRNFRALGGDPGVATYYNGVFSPDFGIAASENALWDLERVEVLRGPQGTLYGRNSIGGALNYVTRKPSQQWEGNVRVQLGEFDTTEVYGVVSGPIIADVLAFRLLGVKRDRDGSLDSISSHADTNSIDDQNISFGLEWTPTDTFSILFRGNDRESDREMGSELLITEGPTPTRGIRSVDQFAFGLREVDSTFANALAFTNPITGEVKYGTPVRPGVDDAAFHAPNAAFGDINSNRLLGNRDKDDPKFQTGVNDDGPNCKFPFTLSNCNKETFDQQGTQTEINWDISDTLSLTYIHGFNDFDFTFNFDDDFSTSDFSKQRQTVEESVINWSHELRLNWSIGDKFTATSGIFYFREKRSQDFSISNSTNRYINPVNYGLIDTPFDFLGGVSILDLVTTNPQQTIGSAPVGSQTIGRWEGNARGDQFHIDNKIKNTQKAVFTQGTYRFNDKFALVLGLRWAQDEKTALEQLGDVYFEAGNETDFFNFAAPILEPFFSGGLGRDVTGLTNLAVLNIAQGNAIPTFNPSNPIAPTCALTDTECATPLRLQAGIPLSLSRTTKDTNTWNDVNYRINLDWTPNDNTLVYFSVTTGYRSGGFSLGIFDSTSGVDGGLKPTKYDQEEITAVEVGYKGTLLDGTLQLNISIYNYDYEDYQDRVNIFDPVRNDQVDVVKNVDSARNSGFEIEVLWLATDNWTIGGNYSFTDTAIDSNFNIAIIDDPSLPASLFGNAVTAPELFVVNTNGDNLKGIPENKAVLWAGYRKQTRFGTIGFNGSYAFTGEFFDESFERGLDEVPNRFRIDLSATWQDLSGRWKVRIFADNVTDEENIRSIDSGTEATNFRLTGTALYPRFLGLDVSYNFGAY